MKNYRVSKIHNYILKYKIENDYIKVYYSNGKIEKIAYSKSAENEILEKMKSQFLDNHDLFNIGLILEAKDNLKTLSISGCAFIPSLILLLNLHGTVLSTIMFGSLYATSLIASTVFAVRSGIKIKQNISKMDDLNKYEEFLENEQSINENLWENPEILNGIKFKTLKAIFSSKMANKRDKSESKQSMKFVIEKNEPPININTLENIPHNDLYVILENIEEEKQKSLQLKPKNRRQ